jgi:ABC-2 type transport system ATP-binding protein
VLRQVSSNAATSGLAVEAVDLVKDFGDTRAVNGVSLAVPTGSIYGLLGPNGAGKTTTLRMLIGIIDPSSGVRRVLGREDPIDAAPEVGYLPEERGLYPSMHARDAIGFMGALRGLPIAEGRKRADELLAQHGLGEWSRKSIRSLSKGMAQTVQLLGSIVHRPKLIVLDEPFSGLDAINQGRLEEMIRTEARNGATILFSTHVIAHAERLCERIAIIAKGTVAFDGSVAEARDRLRPIVRLRTRASDGPWRSAIPPSARREGDEYVFELPEGGPEPLLKALIDGGAGIETLAIERPGLHDAFVAIAGNQAAAEMGAQERSQ